MNTSQSVVHAVMQSRGLSPELVEFYLQFVLQGVHPGDETLAAYLAQTPDDQIAMLRQHAQLAHAVPAVPQIPALPTGAPVSLPADFDPAHLTVAQVNLVAQAIASDPTYKGTTAHQAVCRAIKLINTQKGLKGESLVATQERMKLFSPEVLTLWQGVRVALKPLLVNRREARKPAKESAWNVFRPLITALFGVKAGDVTSVKGQLAAFNHKEALLGLSPAERTPAWVYAHMTPEQRARCSPSALAQLRIAVIPVAESVASVA